MIYCNTKNRIGRRTAQREIREYQADAPIVKSSSTHNDGSDVGILSVVNDEHQHSSYGALFEGSRLLAPRPKIPGCDSSNVVACVDGYTEDGSSCADVCIDIDTDLSGCCIGTYACTNFTGLICRDTSYPSCYGPDACKNATIGSVLKSCVGVQACKNGGRYEGNIGSMEASCRGTGVCLGIASYGGSIQEIYNSCFDQQACRYLATGGVVGKVSNSCDGSNSCFAAGGYNAYYGNGVGGEITLGISGSCNALNACQFAASDGGYLQFIKDGCNSVQACLYLATQTPSIETKGKDTNRKCINNCCSNEQACAQLLQNNTVDDLPADCGQCKKNLFN